MNIKDKVAIVTGASSGIGEAAAKLFSKNGAKVALVARSKEKLNELSKELFYSFAVVCDMSNEEEVKKMVQTVQKHYGRIDILINNAGQGYDAQIEKINPKIFSEVFDLDVLGPLVAMQCVIPIMKKQGSGAIVNISSGTALMSIPGMAAYSSLKRALVGLSLTAREELKEENISVSVVYPYITNTDFEKNTIKEEEWEGGTPPQEADSADHVAKIILEAVEKGEAELFAHDWMKKEE